ncbi:hypothetical protein AM2_1335 [Lactococcus cremoris]|nr:hypothetical protein SK110_0536 [Lactococcus cremoris]KZK53933.1 hypothetical protein AM2_1335 [Lactococcus cremoris]
MTSILLKEKLRFGFVLSVDLKDFWSNSFSNNDIEVIRESLKVRKSPLSKL